nr:MAG TPA: hypothetical protein [Caudoviricetes sp.]
MGVQSVQRCKGFRLLCSCKKSLAVAQRLLLMVGTNADSIMGNMRTPQCSERR